MHFNPRREPGPCKNKRQINLMIGIASTTQIWFFTNSLHYRSRDSALFIIVVNGTGIHKYLGHPYSIHKCLNVVQMFIFYYIFLYISQKSLLN